MGVTDKMVKQLQDSFLGEGATVQFAVAGFGRHPVLLAGGLLGALLGKPRTLVVTDKATHLVKTKRASDLTQADVIGTYPRAISYTSTFVTMYKVVLGDEKIYFSKVFGKGLKELFPQS